MPWPTVAVVGGAVLGLLLAGVSRVLAAAGGRAAARRATTSLRTAVGRVAQDEVVEPVARVVARLEECRTAAQAAVGRGGRR